MSAHRAPRDAPRRTLALSLFLFLLLAGGAELIGRAQDLRPYVADSLDWWGRYRDQVYGRRGQRTLVLAGTSRAQCGLNPEVLDRAFPDVHVVQLAIPGSSSQAVLRDLCADEAFSGVILYDTTPFFMIEGEDEAKARAHVDHYWGHGRSNPNRSQQAETFLRAALQSRFVLLSPYTSLQWLYKMRFQFSETAYIRYHRQTFRRAMRVDYVRMAEENEDWRRFVPETAEEEPRNDERALRSRADAFYEDLETKWGAWNRRLTERGGRLILVYMPSSDDKLREEERRYPRARFWDPITERTGIPTIHFKDYPDLSGFTCLDQIHLDAADIDAFTERLASRLRPYLYPTRSGI